MTSRSDAERLSLALAAANLGDWSWDLQSDVVTFSERAAAIFGIPPGPRMTWTNMRTLLHPDDGARAHAAVEHALATRSDYNIEYRVVNGHERWVLARGRGLYEGDAVTGMIGVVQDVTEQVHTRETLRQQAESLDTINRVGQLLSAELDLHKLVQSVTDAATELTGAEFGAFFYNVLDGSGGSYMLYTLSGVPAEKFSKFPMPRATALFGPTFRGEGIIRVDDVRQDPRFGHSAPHHGMPKGHLPVVSYLAVPVISRSGEVLGGLFFGHSQAGVFDARAERIVTGLAGQAGIAVDNARLFESAQRERLAAEEVNQRFRTVTSTNPALTLYEQDRDLRYTWVFPVRPSHPSENIGKTDTELLVPDGAVLEGLKRRVLESGVGSRTEVTVHLPRGESVFDLVIEPRRDADGNITGVGGVAIDITERKRNELLLQRAQDQAHASELRLLEADRRKDEFLAMLAHELRNPLAPIRTGLHLLRVANTPDAVNQVHGMMERQVGHIVRLVDDLLDVSRITSGKIQLRPAMAAVHDLVRNAVETNQAAIDAAGVTLNVAVPSTLPTVYVDSTRMVQVIANVLNNAVKFSKEGSRILCEARVSNSGSMPHIEIAITDTGAGIAPDLLPRVFELFVQGEQSHQHRSNGGLGIGLALARKLVEMHGGTIDATSEGHGRGSTFIISVPVAAEAGNSVPASESSGTRVQTRKRVLVVDDNEDSCEMLALLIQHMGGEVRTAADGESAVREAAAFMPDVVLLDIGLPGIDGYEACRQIRRQLGSKATLAALTGWGQEQDKQRARDAGFDTHLTKPADPRAIEALLANASTPA